MQFLNKATEDAQWSEFQSINKRSKLIMFREYSSNFTGFEDQDRVVDPEDDLESHSSTEVSSSQPSQELQQQPQLIQQGPKPLQPSEGPKHQFNERTSLSAIFVHLKSNIYFL
jgi:hypothetical protein